ncbi:hypothetical protein PM3016_5479 [Paenibacillus mucilaginosus 3016]|uniref:Uncharacterized protein n=1 Tax=Paenibacillus mucilaginosus 3016 TaxID=1116391 RepID=H6NG52_9BACL|nr:hypothetical protein [Paenibacillus mucilaginosus]AFC32179.1 hypothetical protein PM3016_5479 [Paenibacillus mucilaginosus 3016]WFA20674.1 hypothetical protein ERY13_27250 [Paenibacillus mucilaginosus]
MKDVQVAWSVVEAKAMVLRTIVGLQTEMDMGYTIEEVVKDLEELLEMLDGIESGARMKGDAISDGAKSTNDLRA